MWVPRVGLCAGDVVVRGRGVVVGESDGCVVVEVEVLLRDHPREVWAVEADRKEERRAVFLAFLLLREAAARSGVREAFVYPFFHVE